MPGGWHLPPLQAIVEARAAFDRAKASGDADEAESLTGELDDLDSVGWAEAGALRDEVALWLAGWPTC